MQRMAKEGVAISIQAVMSLEAFADPEAITFFTNNQKIKAAKVNSGAGKLMEYCRKYKPILVSGGHMFAKAFQHRQADIIIGMVTMGGSMRSQH
jgi:hypothetical protein